jgi:hypothetical protein
LSVTLLPLPLLPLLLLFGGVGGDDDEEETGAVRCVWNEKGSTTGRASSARNPTRPSIGILFFNDFGVVDASPSPMKNSAVQSDDERENGTG